MILKNGNVLQYNDLEISFKKTDIQLKDGIICKIDSSIIPTPGEQSIDLKGDFLFPGMVNSHYHSYTNILRGTSLGEPLEIWSHDTVSLGRALDKEDMKISTELGICEMLRSGVTSCVDHLPHLNTAATAAEVYKSSGFKVGLAPMLHNIKDSDLLYGYNINKNNEQSKNAFPTVREYVDYYEDFIDRFHRPDKNLQVMVGINSPQRSDSELLKACSEISHRFNLQIHSHLLETKWQRISADCGLPPLKIMDQFDLIGEKTSFAHCLWLNNEELDLISEKKAIVVSNPTSNAFLGNRVFPLEEFIKRDITIALGSDGVNCGTNNNMNEILRFFLLMQRSQESDYKKWIGIKDGYDMVTINGSKVLNFPIASGQIKVNYGADIVIVDKDSFLNILDRSIPIQMIFHPFNTSVKHVIINGEFIMKDKTILSIDEEELRERLHERKAQLESSLSSALQSASIEKKKTLEIYKKINW